jgi:hypothetical protein
VGETLTYDTAHRLTQVSGTAPMSIAYHANGNIDTKTGHGTYSYDPNHPHRVVATSEGASFSYDANGNMTDRDGTTLTWTSDNKPAQISAAGHTRQFSYAPSRARFRQVATEGGQSTETLYIAGGLYERVSGPTAPSTATTSSLAARRWRCTCAAATTTTRRATCTPTTWAAWRRSPTRAGHCSRGWVLTPYLGGYPERVASCLYLMGRKAEAREFIENFPEKYREYIEGFATPFLELLHQEGVTSAVSGK